MPNAPAGELSPFLRAALDQTFDAIAIFTADDWPVGARIVYVNPAFVRLSGFTRDQLVGHSALLLAGARPLLSHVRELGASNAREDEVFHAITRKARPDGTSYLARLRVASLQNDDGEVTHFILTQRDISSERERENEHERLDESGETLAAAASWRLS
jgi:PAS domain S-box-containing protein